MPHQRILSFSFGVVRQARGAGHVRTIHARPAVGIARSTRVACAMRDPIDKPDVNTPLKVLRNAGLKEDDLALFTDEDLVNLKSAGFLTPGAFQASALDRHLLESTLPGRYALHGIIKRAFAPGGEYPLSYAPRRIFGVGLAVNPKGNYYVDPGMESLVSDLTAGMYCVLIGPRQSGKTTTILWVMEKLRRGADLWPVCVGGLEDAKASWDTSDMWRELIGSLSVSCPEHFGNAQGSSALAFKSLFRKEKLTSPVCLIIDEADSLLNLPENCLDSFFATIRDVKQHYFEYNLASILLVGVESVKNLLEARYRRSLLEGLRHEEAAAGEAPRNLSPFPHDYTLRAPGFTQEDIVSLLEQVNSDLRGAVRDVQQIASSIMGLTGGHKGLVGTCLSFILRLRLFTYDKWLARIDAYDLGTYVFGQATYSRIVEKFKQWAASPEGYNLLVGFLEDTEKLCNPTKVRDLLADGVLAVKRPAADGKCYIGISSPLLWTAMLRECDIISDEVEAPPSAKELDRKWVILKVVQTMDMKTVMADECQNVNAPAEYVLQFGFMCRLKAVLKQAYPLLQLVVFPEVKEVRAIDRSEMRLDTLVKDGSRFGFEFLVNGTDRRLKEYLKRAKEYNKQHHAQVFLVNFSFGKPAKEIRPDHDSVMFVGVTYHESRESVTLSFLDCNGCRDNFEAPVTQWNGKISFQ